MHHRRPRTRAIKTERAKHKHTRAQHHRTATLTALYTATHWSRTLLRYLWATTTTTTTLYTAWDITTTWPW